MRGRPESQGRRATRSGTQVRQLLALQMKDNPKAGKWILP